MATVAWRSNWVAEKRDVALRLANGEAGGSYAEAAILLCAALSALAAELWPGRRIDRARFIEILASVGSDTDTCKLISVPLIVRHLKSEGRVSEATQVARTLNLPSTALVLTGPEIDRSEGDVAAACSALTSADIRRWSYASVLYEHVRSSYAHEYQPGEAAVSWPMTMKPDQHVSYSNRLEMATIQMERLIHFHAEWLGELAVSRADALDHEPSVPRSLPNKWWAEGA
jgi:hypothetical protein